MSVALKRQQLKQLVAERLTDEGRRCIPEDMLPALAIASRMAGRPVKRVPDDGVRFALCRLWNLEKYLNCLGINLRWCCYDDC